MTGEQCLVHLLKASFSGFRRLGITSLKDAELTQDWKSDWELAAGIVNSKRIKWIVSTLHVS